jgi:hypothetical protein
MNDIGNIAKMTIDGTDFKVLERRDENQQFDKTMFSVKHKAAGLKYEVGVCIRTGYIVWINSPFKGGRGDLTIFKNGLQGLLEPGEKVHADRGYRFAQDHCFLPHDPRKRTINSYVRAIHEGINRRFKTWNCLGRTWRHSYPRHGDVFSAVAVITQIAIENDEPVAVWDYDEPQDFCLADGYIF